MPDFDVLILGDCNPDLLLSGDDVVPRFGQVERMVQELDLVVGGSGAIFACASARLGLRTAIAGAVGDDLFGRFMLDALASRGVDTRHIALDSDLKTGLTVVLSRPEDRAILTFPGAITAARTAAVDVDLVRSVRHVHVSSMFLQGALAPQLPKVFAEARKAGVSTSVDPNWDPEGRWNGGLKRLLELTDVFLPNEAEASMITGQHDPKDAALALAQAGPLVAVKLGAEGALAARRGEIFRASAYSNVDTVDTTGAGDAFDAGFLLGVLGGWELERTLAFACACGALSTRAPGGTTAQPTFEEAMAAAQVQQ
ncbi:MAG: carbohydrate kinase family protein [Solirubrobacteraceae bacterium]